jgi:hypothetical protein
VTLWDEIGIGVAAAVIAVPLVTLVLTLIAVAAKPREPRPRRSRWQRAIAGMVALVGAGLLWWGGSEAWWAFGLLGAGAIADGIFNPPPWGLALGTWAVSGVVWVAVIWQQVANDRLTTAWVVIDVVVVVGLVWLFRRDWRRLHA